MENKRNIKSYFEGILNNIDIILKDDFYEEKENLINVQEIIEKWYSEYLQSKSLKNIDYKKLEYMKIEITDFFDKYFISEPLNKNYSERLSYDYSHLEHYWKDEMLGGMKNGR